MRIAVVAAATCLSLVGLSGAQDVEAAIKRVTNIPAQPLTSALQVLAKAHGFQIVYRSDLVSDIRTRGATGELTTDEALTQLLNGTALAFKYLDDRTITIIRHALAGSGATERTSRAPRGAVGQDSAGTGADPHASPRVNGDGTSPSFWDRFWLAQAEQTKAAANGSVAQSSNRSGTKHEIEEIVVTAQKRIERLTDVPMSITVLRGEELDRSTAEGITDALNRVPGVAATLGGQAGGTQLSVRGVTAAATVFSGSTPIGYYLDSVPLALVRTAVVPDATAYDLERVEVLRGPQGTLYGASSLGGIVRVLTADANADEFEFKARTLGSTTNLGGENYRGEMAMNLPLVRDRLGARLAVGYQDTSGWIDRPNAGVRDANDAETFTARLKLNAQPTDALSIGMLGWFSRADVGAPPFGTAEGTHISFVELPQSSDFDVYGVRVAYEFPAFTFTSATSHIDLTQSGFIDLNTVVGNPPVRVRLLTDLESQVFSQELVLHSKSPGNWRWSLGGMYRDAEDHNFQFRPNRFTASSPAQPVPIDWTDTSESFAAFGEATRLFAGGRVELTAGLRYFEDDVQMRENIKVDGSNSPLALRTSTFDAVTPRVTVTAHWSKQLTLYASYSEGFRSGFDQNPLVLIAAPQFPSVNEDRLSNYEIGAKGNLLGGRVTFDSALYYTDWQDPQQVLLVQFLGVTVGPVVNAGEASGIGAEFSVTTRPTERWELALNASWNDLAFDSTVLSAGMPLFVKGERLAASPEYTVGASADYTFALGGGYEAQLSVSGNYISEQTTRFIVPSSTSVTTGDRMFLGRVGFTVNSPGRWSAGLFADNVTDEDGVILPAILNNPNDLRTRPRTIGAQLEYRF